MVNYDPEVLAKLLEKEGIDCNSIYYKNRLLRAMNWLEKYCNNEIDMLQSFNKKYFDSLSEKEKGWVKQTLEVLKDDYSTTKELQDRLYDIVKEQQLDSKELKKQQRRYFQIIYNMILGKDNGPKLGLLLFAMSYEDICSKLMENYEKSNVLK